MYQVAVTYTGWAEPPPDREEWLDAAFKLSGEPDRLKRSCVALFDELGKTLEEWPEEQPRKPQDKPLLLCDWDVVWEVETDRKLLRLNQLKWLNGLAPTVGNNSPVCLEEEGPSVQLV